MKTLWEKRKCWLPAFSPFTMMFSKTFSLRVVGIGGYRVKGLNGIVNIGFLNRVISVISVVLTETTLTISDSTGETVSMESDIVRVVSLSTTEISEVARLKI